MKPSSFILHSLTHPSSSYSHGNTKIQPMLTESSKFMTVTARRFLWNRKISMPNSSYSIADVSVLLVELVAIERRKVALSFITIYHNR